MDLFEDKEQFKDKVADHRTTNIPNHLAWDKMGPAILQGVEKRKKKRRFLIWWSGMVVVLIGCSLLFWWYSIPSLATNDSTTKSPKELSFSDNRTKNIKEHKNLVQKPNNIRAEAASLNLEKTTAYKNSAAQELSINTRKKTSNNTSSIEPFNHVDNSFIVPAILPQSNKELPFKDTLAKDTTSIEPRLVLAIEHLPTSYKLLADKTKELPLLPIYINQKIVSSNWQLELAGGSNWWEEGLTAEKFIEPINETQMGWQLDARINRRFSKYWSVKLGLHFQNLRYKSAFEQTKNISVYQANTADVIFINSLTGAQTISYRDSIPGIQNRKFQHFNQHTTLQIPLLIGFTLEKNRWKYALHTGPSLQFLQFSTGRIALTKDTVFDLPDKSIYPTKLKINYLLEAQIAYQVTPKLSVFNRWRLEQQLTNWLAAPSSFQQRPSIRAMSFGIARSF